MQNKVSWPDEVAGAWLHYETSVRAQQKCELPIKKGEFKKSVWDDFDPIIVANILLDNRNSYYFHKSILFDAYMAWMICPESVKLIQASIVLATLRGISRKEDKFKNLIQEIGALVDWYIRFHEIGFDFFTEIYYPIGGVRAFSRAPARFALRRRIAKNRNAVKTIVSVMEICHYVGSIIQPKNGRSPSISGAMAIFDSMKEGGEEFGSVRASSHAKLLKGRALNDQLKSRRKTVALLYAAESIYFDQYDASFLDLILDGNISYRDGISVFPALIGRARYICYNIIPKIAEDYQKSGRDIAGEGLSVLPIVDELEVSVPELTEQERNEVHQRFSRIKAKVSDQ